MGGEDGREVQFSAVLELPLLPLQLLDPLMQRVETPRDLVYSAGIWICAGEEDAFSVEQREPDVLVEEM